MDYSFNSPSLDKGREAEVRIEPGKGILIPKNAVRPLRQALGEKTFWDADFQEILHGPNFLDLAKFLPQAHVDDTNILFQLQIDGKEYAGISRPLHARYLGDPEFERLQAAMQRFKDLAEDPYADPSRASAIKSFRLPDPVQERSRYRVYERNGRNEVLVLWGYKAIDQNAEGIAPAEFVSRLKKSVRPAIGITARWASAAALICLLIFAAAVAWNYADKNPGKFSNWFDQNAAPANPNDTAVSDPKATRAGTPSRSDPQSAAADGGGAAGQKAAPTGTPSRLGQQSAATDGGAGAGQKGAPGTPSRPEQQPAAADGGTGAGQKGAPGTPSRPEQQPAAADGGTGAGQKGAPGTPSRPEQQPAAADGGTGGGQKGAPGTPSRPEQQPAAADSGAGAGQKGAPGTPSRPEQQPAAADGGAGAGQKGAPGTPSRPEQQPAADSGAGAGQKGAPGTPSRPEQQPAAADGGAGAGQKGAPGTPSRPGQQPAAADGGAGAGQKGAPGTPSRPEHQPAAADSGAGAGQKGAPGTPSRPGQQPAAADGGTGAGQKGAPGTPSRPEQQPAAADNGAGAGQKTTPTPARDPRTATARTEIGPQTSSGPTTITITPASDAQPVADGIRIVLNAQADPAPQKYQWIVDGVPQTETSSRFGATLPPGSHDVIVKAIDDSGREVGTTRRAIDLTLSAGLTIRPR